MTSKMLSEVKCTRQKTDEEIDAFMDNILLLQRELLTFGFILDFGGDGLHEDGHPDVAIRKKKKRILLSWIKERIV